MMIKKFLILFILICSCSVVGAEEVDYQNLELGVPSTEINSFTVEEAEKLTKMKFTETDFLQAHKNMLFFQKTDTNTFFINFPPLELEDDIAFANAVNDFDKLPKEDRKREMTAEKVTGIKVVRSLFYAQKDSDFYIYNTSYYFKNNKLFTFTTFERNEMSEKFVEKEEKVKKLLILKQRDEGLKKDTEKEKKEKIAELLKNAESKHKELLKEKLKSK